MRTFFALTAALILTAVLMIQPAGAAWWGVAGCSTTDSGAVFTYNWQSQEFDVGPGFPLGAYGNYPYDAVMRPWTEDEVWIPGASGDGVVVVDEFSTVIKEFATGGYPVSIAFSPQYDIALVSCRDDDRLDIVDINQYAVIGSLDIPGAHPGNIIYSPRDHCFFLVEWYGDMLFKIAPDGSEILDQVSAGSSLWQLAIDPNFGGELCVTDRGTDQVLVIDNETLAEIRTIDVGDDPWGIDIEYPTVVVCCEDSKEVYWADIYTGEVFQFALPADAEPRDVSISTGFVTVGDRVLMGCAYVCGGQTAEGSPIYVFDLYSRELINTILLPGTNANVVTVEPQWYLPSAVDDLPGPAALKVTAAPNPFNPSTTVHFTMDDEAEVTVGVFDVAGHLVRRIEAGTMVTGPRSVIWDGTDRAGRRCAGGTYLMLVQAGDLQAATKVVLVP